MIISVLIAIIVAPFGPGCPSLVPCPPAIVTTANLLYLIASIPFFSYISRSPTVSFDLSTCSIGSIVTVSKSTGPSVKLIWLPMIQEKPPKGGLSCIGVTRFELMTFCSQSRRSTRLSYTPSVCKYNKITFA